MAELASIAGGDVRRQFAAGFESVVTTNAIIDNGTVIDRGWNPGLNAMANVAFILCRHMCGMLAGCEHTVVAHGTHRRYL